jgi:hypothetical protein
MSNRIHGVPVRQAGNTPRVEDEEGRAKED